MPRTSDAERARTAPTLQLAFDFSRLGWLARDPGPRAAEDRIVRPDGSPDARAPAAAAPPPRAEPPGARDVLVIEDNVDAAETLSDLLALEGHAVRFALDGLSGLALARERRPDVVVCDIGLPDVDGYEVARTIRSDPALRAIRLVALTGYALPEDRARALAAGFDVHLAKPPDLDELARALWARGTAG